MVSFSLEPTADPRATFVPQIAPEVLVERGVDRLIRSRGTHEDALRDIRATGTGRQA